MRQQKFNVSYIVSLLLPCILATGLHAVADETITEIGNPEWKLEDFQVFSATADSLESFNATIASIVPGLGGSLRTPKPPPYDTLISDGLGALGIEPTTTFREEDINSPLAVFFAYTMVPDPGEIGMSFDFDSGPIIPEDIFPITEDGVLLREGVAVDDDLDSVIELAGDSHIPSFYATSTLFFPPNTESLGNYEFRTSIRDVGGNGWDVVAPFQVVPEPDSLFLSVISIVVLASVRRKNSCP